ncbi:MAG TPA: hypothetical protein VNA25_28030 [Phycisphaerae bacterium]|nr:hypothetical protein [Phycisphaerae bacterium]
MCIFVNVLRAFLAAACFGPLSRMVQRNRSESALLRQANGQARIAAFRAVRARGGHGFAWRRAKVGQGGHGVRFLPDQDVAVPAHREVDVAVPHEALCHLRMNAAGGQEASGRVPQAVEIHHAPGIVAVENPGRFQVAPQHPHQPPLGRHVERRGGRQLARQETAQLGGRVEPQRQHVAPPMLAERGFHGHGRLVVAQGETRPRQASQFPGP